MLRLAPRGFAPAQFLPWVEARLREGFEVHVVYESCGFGFGLYRALLQAGAHCYVIAPLWNVARVRSLT
jgi:transposase